MPDVNSIRKAFLQGCRKAGNARYVSVDRKQLLQLCESMGPEESETDNPGNEAIVATDDDPADDSFNV